MTEKGHSLYIGYRVFSAG